MIPVAILGAGSIVEHAHLPAWQKTAGARVVAIVDVRREAAERLAGMFDIPRVETDIRAVLDDPAIAAVDICLPHYLHAPVALECLRAGKHVLLEKPLAVTRADATTLVRAAEESGRLFMVAENWRYTPAFTLMHQIIQSGEIGRPLLLRGVMEFVIPQRLLANRSWRTQAEQAGGGVILDSGIHAVSVAQWFMGEAEAVAGFRARQSVAAIAPMEDTAVLAIQFPGGAVGSITFSWAAPHARSVHSFEVVGERGVVRGAQGDPLVVVTADGQTREHRVDPSSGFPEEMAHFVKCIQEECQPITTARVEAGSLAFVLAAYQSLREGRAVPIEPIV